MPPTYETLNRVSSKSALKNTGKTWDQWVSLLDAAGARSWSHKELVLYLKKKKLSPWWQQGVAGAYSVAIGKKIEGRNAKGELSVTATKSFSIDSKKMWALLCSKQGQEIWLQPLSPMQIKVGAFFETKDGFFGEIRTMKKGLRLRLSWKDPEWSKPTYLQVFVVPRPDNKCLVAFTHEKIKEPKVEALLRRRWKQATSSLHALAN